MTGTRHSTANVGAATAPAVKRRASTPRGGWFAATVLSLAAALGAGNARAQVNQSVAAVHDLSCLGQRAGGSLNCTAKEFTVSPSFSIPNGSCQAGSSYTLASAAFTLSGSNTDRYDIGFFFGQQGNVPGLTTSGNICSVATFAVTGAPWQETENTFDVCSDFNGGATASPTITNIKVLCQADPLTGSLSIPYTLMYETSKNNNNMCAGPSNVYIDVPSKCQQGTATVGAIKVRGFVTVTKQTTPDGAAGSFRFSASGPAGSNVTPAAPVFLSDGGSQTFELDLAGSANRTLSISEDVIPAGWLANATLSCTSPTGGAAGYVTYVAATRTINADLNATNYGAICTLTNTRETRVATTKTLSPAADPGRFNLVAGGTTVNDQGNNGTTGLQAVTAGTSQTFSETAFTGTDLANYTTTYNCTSNAPGFAPVTGTGTSVTLGPPSANPLPPANYDTTCTFTNTRRTFPVSLGKAWVAAVAGDTAALSITGATGATAGNSTAPSTTTNATATGSAGSTITLSETFGAGNVGSYGVTLTCTRTTAPLTSTSVTLTGNSGSIAVPSDSGLACTFTNSGASANVGISKTLNTPAPHYVGQVVQYDLVVSNAGPDTANNISVTDTPTNLSITTVSGAGCSALPCTIPSLASGASVTITVTATIPATGSFDNSASANATQFDPTPANNTDSTGNGGTALASANLAITKGAPATGPFVAGQTVTWNIVLTNAGPSAATSVVVTDTPTNISGLTLSGNPGCSGSTCNIASVANGATINLTATGTVTAAGSFDNGIAVSSATFDPVLANNSDNAGNDGTAGASANVALVKTLTTTGPYYIGQTVQYDLVVSNAGPSAATAIQVTDTPSNLAITGVSGSGCAALPCTIANLASGANTTITVTATINATGAFDNSATATAAQFDPDTANNTDATGNGGTALPRANIGVAKTLLTSGPFAQGQVINYSIVVSNAGPSTATSVLVTDTPSNLTLGTVSGACTALPCTIASIASGSSATINVSATIDAAGSFDNGVTVSAAENDPVPANNSDPSGNGGNAGGTANVAMSKTLDTAGPYLEGQSVTYTLTVSNAGPATATNISVTDTPTNLTITNVTGSGCSALPCTIPSLASGANTAITVTATIGAPGAFDNTATATAVEFDPDTANNTDSSGNGGNAGAVANVAIDKTLLSAGPYVEGDVLNYSLVVSNAGPSTATSISVTDTPTNLTITNVSGACTALPCTIATLASGSNVTINVTATIVGPGAFNNVASATATQFDPNTGNNTDSTGNGGTAVAAANVSMDKQLDTAGPYVQGQSVTYTLTIANAGPSAATGIDVVDSDTNLTITNVSGACTALPCVIANLAAGDDTTITVTATIDGTGAFDNSATALGDEFDPVLANNTDATGNGGNAGGSADLSITKTNGAASVVAGGSTTYTVRVTNAGPSAVAGAILRDAAATGLSKTAIACSATPGACTAGTTPTVAEIEAAGGYALPTLAPGAFYEITITATVSAASGNVSNVATITPPAGTTDPGPGPNTGTDTDAVSPRADLSLAKGVSDTTPDVGQTITFTLTVSNAGPSDATGVVVTDLLPSGYLYVSDTGDYTPATGAWNVGTVTAGGSASIDLVVTVLGTGSYGNTAEITASGVTDPDSTPGDGTGDDFATNTPAVDDVPNAVNDSVGSSRVDLQACKLEYSIVSPK